MGQYSIGANTHAGAQSIFIQNAAHQLRTPFALLNTQLSYAVRTAADSERIESLNAAYGTLQHAIRLLNQLLTLSMAESLEADTSTVNVAPINLANCIQEIFEALAGKAQCKGISLGFDMTKVIPDLRVNPWVVKEMLSNVLDNAIRYTPQNGSVTVRIEVVKGQIEVVIEDNGPGISSQYRDKVFERFFRIDNTDSNGSGLGLAIVRELADHINAQVRLADTFSGNGLAVWLIFAGK